MGIDEAQAQDTAARTGGSEQYSQGPDTGAEIPTAKAEQTKAEQPLSIEAVITRGNLMLAYQRVLENKGAAGSIIWASANLKTG
ncbi:hypothetical protein [Sodalis ligni]|uniref:hypothetical protein n=1 Tax=Sodalis ligni TaxID=2697027 RepID=UPI002097D9D4|nr:hypothetical protein [Sodalis ligni]